jgi:uncharacterized protein (TIGR02996 family)
MLTAEGLLQDVLARPQDDAPRLRYADWLDEQCDPLGEFIRVQCRLASLPANHRLALELERREHELLAQHEADWAADLPLYVEWWTFRRGFVHEVGLTSEKFLAHGGELFRRAPIQEFHIDGVRGAMESLASSSYLEQATYLDLSNNAVRDQGARALAGSPHLKRVRGLNLSSSGIGDAGFKALVTSPHLTGLRELYLADNRISSAGVRALAHSPLARCLEVLHLSFNFIGTDGAELLQQRLGDRVHL